MKTEITCVYDRKTNPGILSRLSHGLSLYIKSGGDHILFDTGLMGRILMKNLRNLDIHPNILTKIVISHGHSDHIGGLRKILENRTNNVQIPIYAHPDFKEPKSARILGIKFWNVGFYEIKDSLENKLIYRLSKNPVNITELLRTTGEISEEERRGMTNTSENFARKINGKWIRDPVLDDMSLFFKTQQGVVLICGDCHSGLTNTIQKVQRLSGDKVVTILGAVHVIFSSTIKMNKIVEMLLDEYKHINFHLNHSVGRRYFRFLQKKLGSERIQYFPVGKKLIFES